MDPPPSQKRVSRACDYCRKKRLKCTGQRPCLNCQLYGATCSTSDHPRDSENASRGTKRKQTSTIEQTDPGEERQLPARSEPDSEQTSLQTPRPWNPTSEPEIAPLVQPSETTVDFDQCAYELGLVVAPFWPQSRLSPLQSSSLDTAPDSSLSSLPSYQAHLPSPKLSDHGPFTSVFQNLDLGQNMHSAPFAVASRTEPTDRTISQSAHELFLRKGPVDSKFIGMGSIGSTIFECLRYSASVGDGSMESKVLNHLVRGIRHIDELALSTSFRNPPLPARDFAQRGVEAYYASIHPLYPVMETQLLDEWYQFYNDSNLSLSPVAYSRFCLVVVIGNLASSSRSNVNTWNTAQSLHEETWSRINHVLASPFTESLQVVLLHSLYLLYCGKTGIAWMTCGMAVRIAQSLGLHQQTPPKLDLSPEHLSLRSKLWSVAYTLDAFLSLAEGRPPAIAEPPHRLTEQDNISFTSNSVGTFIHEWDIGLAMIANQVQTLLLKNNKPLVDTLVPIANIDAQLLAWKDTIPMELRPDQEIFADNSLYYLVALLHLKYHNLMRTIHWISLTLSSEAIGGEMPTLSPRLRSSESICLTSARSIIEVLNGMSSHKVVHSPETFVVPYCMAAISIFYRQILKEPNQPGARANLEHMRNGTLHITMLTDGIGSRSHFRALFEVMLKVAEDAVNNAPPHPAIILHADRTSST